MVCLRLPDINLEVFLHCGRLDGQELTLLRDLPERVHERVFENRLVFAKRRDSADVATQLDGIFLLHESDLLEHVAFYLSEIYFSLHVTILDF